MAARFIIVLFLAVSLSGCIVMKSTHDKALAEILSLQAEKNELSGKIKELEENLKKNEQELMSSIDSLKGFQKEKIETDEKIKAMEQEIKARSEEIAQLKSAVDDVRAAKDKEIEEIKSRIKEIQTQAEMLLEKIKEVQK